MESRNQMVIRAAGRVQRLLFAAGFLILGYCAASWLDSRLRQARGNQELDHILSSKPPITVPEATIRDGGLIGRMEIPKLHISGVVFQGTDEGILNHGIGHLHGSALPGQAGNVVLAAHRDTFFRNLRNVKKGDMVMVTTESGPRMYQVDATQVVAPNQISVVKPTPKPTLTLITCYPFYYVGHAPKRFIVQALDMQSARTELTARQVPAEQPAPGRSTPEETANLTYVFKASR